MLPEGWRLCGCAWREQSSVEAEVRVQHSAKAAEPSFQGKHRCVPVERWMTMDLLGLGVGARSPASSTPHFVLSGP